MEKFKIQTTGTYQGMPLFNGIPEHLQDYLNTYLEYVGLEGAAVYATDTRGDYTLTTGKNKGRVIPGAAQAHDHDQGISTDFPAQVGSGQSWNKNLIFDIGTVMGNEQISSVDYADTANFNQVTFAAMSDVRANPLSGRIDEVFGEDAYFTGSMVNEMAKGISGITENKDFWLKTITGTKHFSNYAAQWFRQVSSVDCGIRGLREYHMKTVEKAVKSGSAAGTMTSYGRTNGIPNILSPYLVELLKEAPYSFYTSPDAVAVSHLIDGGINNGFEETYASSEEAAMAMCILAESNYGGISFAPDIEKPLKVMEAVHKGYYGLTKEHVLEYAKTMLTQLVRVGLFNERDEQNLPIGYPFLGYAKGQTKEQIDYHTKENQDIALKAAKESIVLLKNKNNILPLKPDDEIVVMGQMAKARLKTTKSLSSTPVMENTALTIFEGLQKVGNNGKVSYGGGNKIAAFRSKATGKFIRVQENEEGGTLYADAKDCTQAETRFELYDWGQDGYSILSLGNKKWVSNVANEGTFWQPGEVTGIKNTGTEVLNAPDNSWDNAVNVGASTMPAIYRLQSNQDGTISWVVNSYGGSFVGGFETAYYGGNYIITTENNELCITEKLSDKKKAAKLLTDESKFEMVLIQDTGITIEDYTAKKEYAVVVIGAPPKHSSGEGSDRSDLSMGKEQYQLVETVTKRYPGKTIVILSSSFPVLMDEIQKNEDVAAILYQPYGGQYDGYAMGEVVYGVTTPTGHLTNTWYNSMDVLKDLSKYTIPEGVKESLDTLDPRFTKDLTNSDPIQTRLSYMYANPDMVTYEFGYGLTYSEFVYKELEIRNLNTKTGNFEAFIQVENIGNVRTSQVIQLYMELENSVYHDAAYKRKLAAFEKVEIKQGECLTVRLQVSGRDYAVWDTNEDCFKVEKGRYRVLIGESSARIAAKQELGVIGEPISILDPGRSFNVFDRSFFAEDVTYREISKCITLQKLKENNTQGLYAVMSKEKEAYTAIANVRLDGSSEVTLRAAAIKDGEKISIRLDSREGQLLTEIKVNQTAPVTQTIEGLTADGTTETTELGYVEYTQKTVSADGIHNLYIIFSDPDIRLDWLLIR